MPRAVKGTNEEREQFIADVFRKYYQDPNFTGKDLSVNKANELMVKKFGSMLRNKRAYEIRAEIKGQTKNRNKASVNTAEMVTSSREAQMVNPGSPNAAVLVEGTTRELDWLTGILKVLNSAGLSQAQVDHVTDKYAVVARI